MLNGFLQSFSQIYKNERGTMLNDEQQRKLPVGCKHHFLGCLVLVALCVGASAEIETEYSHAVIESCRGCQLNRLPEVKSFIFEDVPLYENVEFKHVQGEPPELVLYSRWSQETKRVELSSLNREELNTLLLSYGFKKSKSDL